MRLSVPLYLGLLVLPFCHFVPAAAVAAPQGNDPYLSSRDIEALRSGHTAWSRALTLARDYQAAKEAQIQGLYLKVQGSPAKVQPIAPDLAQAVNAMGSAAPGAMKKLIQAGARLDSRGRFTLAGFRFQDLHPTRSSALKQAFQTIFPSTKGRWNAILDPKRKTALLIEGQVLLPPAFALAQPKQKFSPALPWSAFELAVGQELSGLDADLRDWLGASREGGTWADLVHEVGAFYLNDVWGKPAWTRAQDAQATAAQDRAGVRLLRLKTKWGLTRDQLDAALSAYSSVLSQTQANRDEAVLNLGAKATAIAMAPLLYPVAAFGLLPAFGVGMGITGVDVLASAGIDTTTRGGAYSEHLARQLDQKLPHGFTFSLLFAPAGMLHGAANSTQALVRIGSRVTSAGLVTAAGVSSVQSGKATWEANEKLKKSQREQPSASNAELEAALRAEAAQNALHAVTDGIFATLGLKSMVPARNSLPATRALRPVAANSEKTVILPDLPAPANEAIALERLRLIDLKTKGFETQEQRFERLKNGETALRPTRSQYMADVLDSAKKLLHLQGTQIELRSILEGEMIVISPIREGSSLNAIAWLLKKRANTSLIFDPEALAEDGSVAYFSADRNEICISYHEILRGSRSRATSLKHEVRHLLREKMEGLPFRGYVEFSPSRPGGYGKFQQFDEVLTHSWDLVDTAKAISTYGRTPYLDKRLRNKVEIILILIKNTREVLQAASTQLDSLRIDTANYPGPSSVELSLPGIGKVTFQLNSTQKSRLDRKNFPVEMGTRQRTAFLNEERRLIRAQLARRLEGELWLLRSLEERIPAFLKETSDLSKLAKELQPHLRYVDVVLDFEAKKQVWAMEAQNAQADEARGQLLELYRDLTHGKLPFESLESAETLLENVDRLHQTASRRFGREVNRLDGRTEAAAHLSSVKFTIKELVTKFSLPLHLSRAQDHFNTALQLRKEQAPEIEVLQEVSDAYHHFQAAGSPEGIQNLRREFPTEVKGIDSYGNSLGDPDAGYGSTP